MLGDIHGGAGQQALELYFQIENQGIENIRNILLENKSLNNGFVPGFGHRFHKTGDPRTPRLLDLVDNAVKDGEISGKFVKIGRQIEKDLSNKKVIPMNIDGATAVIYAELGCPPPLARGLFCLSRSVGILAHTWEQMQKNERIKGRLKAWQRLSKDLDMEKLGKMVIETTLDEIINFGQSIIDGQVRGRVVVNISE